MIIPRAKIDLSYRELFGVIARLFLPFSNPKGAGYISEFEKKFSEPYSLPPAVAFNKSRMAFYFLLKNFELKPGGEVLISALHIADFVNIIYSAGFRPVVVDVNRETYCIDYDDLEKKITNHSVLILITHLSGFITDMDRIKEISRSRAVPFAEDCSQALSADYKGKRLGTFGLAAIFSLSLLKPVCTLCGGVILSNDGALMKKMRQSAETLNQPDRFSLIAEAIKHLILKTATQPLFFNFMVFPLLFIFSAPLDFFSRYQKSNKLVVTRETLPQKYFAAFSWQQALLGLEQLAAVKDKESKKIANAAYLYGAIKDSAKARKVKLLNEGTVSFWTFPLYVEDIRDFKKYLAKRGIDSSGYLLSVLGDEPPFYHFNFKNEQASDIKRHTLLLPMYSRLTEQELKHMATAVNGY